METTAIFWTFLIIFIATAIVTLLGITGVLKSIQARYLNVLFSALILEVIAAMLITYKGADFGKGSEQVVDSIWAQAHHAPDTIQDMEGKVAFLKKVVRKPCPDEALQAGTNGEFKLLSDSLARVNAALAARNAQLDNFDREFYSKVIKLRNYARERVTGNSINISWQPEGKAEVYDLLHDIFLALNMLDPSQHPSPELLRRTYLEFLDEFGVRQKFSDRNGVYITEYTTTLFMRQFLNKMYPLN